MSTLWKTAKIFLTICSKKYILILQQGTGPIHTVSIRKEIYRMKKAFSFLLVCLFVVGMFSVPVNAYYDEKADSHACNVETPSSAEDVIMPRRPACRRCEKGGLLNWVTWPPTIIETTVCPNSTACKHVKSVEGQVLVCDACGKEDGFDKTQTRCVLACMNTNNLCFRPQYLWNYEK